MIKIFYVTGNSHKFKSAKRNAKDFGVNLIQKKLKIKEIQSSSIEKIAQDKAEKAFNLLKYPLIVSDSGWRIPSLGGFPGPYMHYINNWFDVKDFLKLMGDKKDRSIILEHVVCAISSKGLKLFKEKIEGKFIKQPKGVGLPSDRVIKLRGCKYTIAECQNLNRESVDDTLFQKRIYQWLKTNTKKKVK